MSILAQAIEAVHKSYDKAHHIKAEHQSTHFEPILKHLHECYQIVGSHVDKAHVSVDIAENAYHHMRAALSELARCKHKNESIHLLLREVREAEKYLKDLVEHSLKAHRTLKRRNAVRHTR